MRTIGRRWPTRSTQGDHVWPCDYCGVKWRRSQLHRDNSGLLACPDDVGPDKLRIARAPHIPNNYGTGSTYEPPVARQRQSQGHPVVL